MCLSFWKKKQNLVKPNVATSQPVKMKEQSSAKEKEPYVDEKNLENSVDDKIKNRIQKYHVSQNKDKDAEFYMKWRVRKEGSEKTIQFFDTQKEAINFAEGLADRADSTVVIHKLDGSIRKQDYSKQ